MAAFSVAENCKSDGEGTNMEATHNIKEFHLQIDVLQLIHTSANAEAFPST